MNLDELAAKAKKELDNDPDLIIETDMEYGRLIICRTGVDEDDYRVSLEKQIEVEDEDGNMDEECEQLLEVDSDSVRQIVEAYLDEGGEPESI